MVSHALTARAATAAITRPRAGTTKAVPLILAALAALLPATTVAQTYSFTASEVKETAATLTLTGHSDWWHYKRINPSGGTCNAVKDGYVVQLSDLTPGQAYTFHAYNGTSCAAENKLADATFTALDFHVTDKKRTEATLVLEHHDGEWWYQQTFPTLQSCTSGGTGMGTAYRGAQRFLQPGERITASIDGIGTLSLSVVSEAEPKGLTGAHLPPVRTYRGPPPGG